MFIEKRSPAVLSSASGKGLDRRTFLGLTSAAAAGVVLGEGCVQRSSVAERPNVLFIAVDDLNDWVGVLGGHPNASTPNLDRLAARGVCFTNAHCSAPICSASRTSVLSGREPYNSGVYTNAQQFRDYLPDAVSIPQHFMRSGYEVLGAGKMFHSPEPSSFHEEFLIEQKALGSFR